MSDVDPRGSPRAARWISLLGKGFWGLHHYCWGLIHVNRASRGGLSPLQRRGMLESAINDYRYVLINAQPDFLLAPEILLRVGEAHLELGNLAAALESFRDSRRLKPDYWPAYARAAPVLHRLGKRAESLALLEEGLRLMPTEKALIAPYERLGGNYAKFAKAHAASVTAAASSAASAAPAAEAASSAASAPQ